MRLGLGRRREQRLITNPLGLGHIPYTMAFLLLLLGENEKTKLKRPLTLLIKFCTHHGKVIKI